MKDEISIPKMFGTIIKQRRVELGLSQEAFAAKCGLHRTYVGPVERGKKNVTLSTAYKLAKALNLELSDVFAEIEAMAANLESEN